MRKFKIALILGLSAGIIDVIPMIIQKINWYANTSAFVHWLVMGVVITYLDMPLKGWLKGLIIGEAACLPIAIIVLKTEPVSVIPITIMSAILGSAVGLFGEKLQKVNEPGK